MGYITDVRCTHCEHSQMFFMGSGMFPPSSNLSEADSYQRQKLRRLSNINDAKLLDWETLLLHCPKCYTLHQRSWFWLEWPGGETYGPTFYCGQCRSKLTDIPENAHGSGSLRVTRALSVTERR